jgi:hypothetical protein
MNWLNIFALICLIIGLLNGAKGLKSLRSKEPAGAEISWKQSPLSPWRYESPSMIAITVHALGLFCLAVFVLDGVTGLHSFTGSQTASPTFLLSAITLLAVFFTAFSSGVAVAYLFAQPWIRPVSYGISGDGMLYGGSLIGWKSYSHYEVGPDDNMISLYSSYSPQLRTWVFQPPAESFAIILGLIQKNLPSASPAEDSISWQRSPLTMILEMAALVIVALLPAVWGWINNLSWVWMYALLAFFFVQSFGVKLITVFDGRGGTSTAQNVDDANHKPQNNL